MSFTSRFKAKSKAVERKLKSFEFPKNGNGQSLKVSEFFGENIFDFHKMSEISDKVKEELIEVSQSKDRYLSREQADIVAKAAMDWAMARGATHFCHWFQPLTGQTAEKHDAFLDFKDGQMIENFSGGQLMQGEPDASSFPNGGSRSTFEARGYTSWDMSSPLFLIEGVNGKTLCIPTAFISYTGQALDVKTPLLRSNTRLNNEGTRFMNLLGFSDVKSVTAYCGPEQEYFLVDKSLYYSRPDLVMTNRALFGKSSAKNQQLDDHYFGEISERVLSFMQEFDYELYRLGIPAKTRHNEVAPGQFEIAPIFREANLAADNNQLLMTTLKRVANKHDMVALLHEKPFAGINGSGKHINWSFGTDTGINLLEPGDQPHQNMSFLATLAIILEAINRHGAAIRMSIASAGNDHRLGANEAPPSIISVYLGSTLDSILKGIIEGKEFTPNETIIMNMGAAQLAALLQDNTDRNRTSPFAFTGNKFELRAVGSSMAIGLPLSIINAAVADVLADSNDFIEKALETEKDIDIILHKLIQKWGKQAYHVVFNGDGYGEEWLKEADKRGLPNLRTTPDALSVLKDEQQTRFLIKQGIYLKEELDTRYNVLVENYITMRSIEFDTLNMLVQQYVFPVALDYKIKLAEVIKNQKAINIESTAELEIYKRLNYSMESLYKVNLNLKYGYDELKGEEIEKAHIIANELMPISEEVARFCNEIEEIIPDSKWTLPKFFDLLFIR